MGINMLKEIVEELDYESWKEMQAQFNTTVDDLDQKLNKVDPSGEFGDEIRGTSVYKKHKGNYDKAFKLLQKFNKQSPKAFLKRSSKEYRANMMNRGK